MKIRYLLAFAAVCTLFFFDFSVKKAPTVVSGVVHNARTQELKTLSSPRLAALNKKITASHSFFLTAMADDCYECEGGAGMECYTWLPSFGAWEVTVYGHCSDY